MKKTAILDLNVKKTKVLDIFSFILKKILKKNLFLKRQLFNLGSLKGVLSLSQ